MVTKSEIGEWQNAVRRKVVAFRKEVESEDFSWAMSRRSEYLETLLAKHQNELGKWRLLCARLALREKNEYIKSLLFRFGDLGPFEAEIGKVNKKLMGIQNRDTRRRGEVTDEMIARARNVGLSDFVGRRTGSKILCPFHADNTPSAHLYQERAYCFVCHKNIDTLAYVMAIEGLSFVDAVKRLTYS